MSRIFNHGEFLELTRWTGMITLEQLSTGFITRKSGTDLRMCFSDSESETNHQINVPIHKPLDIRGVHTSTGMLPNTGNRWWNKLQDICGGHNAGGRTACTPCCILGPRGGTGSYKGVDSATSVRKGARYGLRVRLLQSEHRRHPNSASGIPRTSHCTSLNSSPSTGHKARCK